MLTCVCRPVSGNLPKMPPSVMPIAKQRQQQQQQQQQQLQQPPPPQQSLSTNATAVVTAEPKLNVPGRLTSAELRAMALRQQQQIDSQQQLLATKEQRLRFLKQQEVRNAVANAEGERLRRLRERVEAQESKLRRLRALRGQVDLQKTYNVTLSNDLDSIRALFSEKEKELSLAVAKVEALTRQLEDLRRDRRCPINLIAGGSTTAGQPLPPQASRELEKLRRELMYRNQLSLQQDARLHLQREALQQRQAELRSVDQRIYELQTRLQRKKAANIQNSSQQQHQQLQHQHQQQQQQQQQHTQQQQPLQNAAINIQAKQSQQPRQQPQKQQQQQQQYRQQSPTVVTSQVHNTVYDSDVSYKGSGGAPPKSGVAALKQQLLQKQHPSQTPYNNHNNSNSPNNSNNKFSNIINRETTNRNISRGNVAAVEPYIHTPQKSSITTTSSYLGNILKHAAATANTNQQNQLIQDHTHVKLNLTASHHTNNNNNNNTNNNNNSAPVKSHLSGASVTQKGSATNSFTCESDESKLAKKKMLTATISTKMTGEQNHSPVQSVPSIPTVEVDTSHHIYAEVGPKKPKDLNRDNKSNNSLDSNSANANNAQLLGSKIPKSIPNAFASSPAAASPSYTSATSSPCSAASTHKANSITYPQTSPNPQQPSPGNQNHLTLREKSDLDKKIDKAVTSETLSEKNTQQLTVHSMPLGTANKSMATAVSNCSSTTQESIPSIPFQGSNKSKPLVPTGTLAVPPRKPISSVAPTPVSSSIPKIIPYSPKVNRVAPNIVATVTNTCNASDRPALPPKPHKMMNPETTVLDHNNKKSNNGNFPTATGAVTAAPTESSGGGIQTQNINDNLPIKAKPLTIRKQPLCEQPRLKSSNAVTKLPNNSQAQPIRKMDFTTSNNTTTTTNGTYTVNDKRAISDSSNESVINDLENTTIQQHQQQQQQPAQNSPNTLSPQSSSSTDETDRSNNKTQTTEEKPSPDSLKRRMRTSSNVNGLGGSNKPKLTRRVSFDPLALLLDASLEGELELVKKTAMQVANPSAANDEGITALHNAICAGHFDIVKFLVEFGCDVNAQDSDGWTPLHCAASCNNLAMVKFLVENGACLFAATLSDHETPAEKCEEDEEGFDGCSEYLYSIQEKLGILHNGEVYAVFSYEAQNTDELTFSVNDRLIILRKGDDAESEWWWAKKCSEDEGYVPRNLLGLHPRMPPQASNYAD